MNQLLITAQKVKQVDSDRCQSLFSKPCSENQSALSISGINVKLGHYLVFLNPSKMSGKTSFFKFFSAKSFISVSHILTLSVEKTYPELFLLAVHAGSFPVVNYIKLLAGEHELNVS